MLFLNQQRLVFLSVPKTASTSIEQALAPYSAMSLTAPPSLKHMGYTTFLREIAPAIEKSHGLTRSDYTVMAVIREPLSWVHSWYRYRSRDELKDPNAPNRANFCGHVSFSEFVRAYCSAEPPPYARIGNQLTMLLDRERRIGVDRIFPYERLDALAAFLSGEIGYPITLPELNQSPLREFDLDPDAELPLRQKLRRAIEVHRSLREDGRLGDAVVTGAN